ncbi:hypothetical protein UFOVP119_14 [uncultured Caudovirales phage]|uniref:Uncharacterized protein n=1 Tax=uncultured Caudovirales phage TaxID=2100421 RepID=A0A6J5LBU4_9CAUD|nr:hypothetical protein UFOVP119_14 [uncultured Caudovirales phage]
MTDDKEVARLLKAMRFGAATIDLSTHQIAQAMSACSPGVNYRGCTLGMLVDAYVNGGSGKAISERAFATAASEVWVAAERKSGGFQ